MAGTKSGGMKAAATNKSKYGEDFYSKIGVTGGKNGTTGGFYNNPDLAREAGSKGGAASSRGIPRLLIVGDFKKHFETVKEATEYADARFGVRGSKYTSRGKELALINGGKGIIIKDPVYGY